MYSKALLLLLVSSVAKAQFTCTFSGAQDESGCVSTTDGANHCVWCELSSFGFCVSEEQAEAMEQKLPGVECDRYSDNDDDETPDDNDDDKAPDENDDDATPSDDSIPDDYWTCLQKKTAKECTDGCTWCDTKAGFGVCMTGPSAEWAAESDWFNCQTKDTTTTNTMLRATKYLENPYDSSCINAFLLDQTEEACVAATDETGTPCEWCTIAGMATVCLTAEQAAMGAPIGIACDVRKEKQQDDVAVQAADPFDTACALAYLQDKSKEGCENAKDSDGLPCIFCSLEGASLDVCLNEEQAQAAEQWGLDCGDDVEVKNDAKDPYDTACMLAYLQDQSKAGCVQAFDREGNPCEYCTLNGAFNVCLTLEQAQYGQQLGMTCDQTAQDNPVLASE